ncbi:hypothetical protein HPULCUR_001828 [Helicostylum pulchrum]|uniref:Hac prophage II protein n=1 Tax=Helicostylum pulchrum TaxID=562976 RepID=A0ABP9XNU4_9FUNG
MSNLVKQTNQYKKQLFQVSPSNQRNKETLATSALRRIMSETSISGLAKKQQLDVSRYQEKKIAKIEQRKNSRRVAKAEE